MTQNLTICKPNIGRIRNNLDYLTLCFKICEVEFYRRTLLFDLFYSKFLRVGFSTRCHYRFHIFEMYCCSGAFNLDEVLHEVQDEYRGLVSARFSPRLGRRCTVEQFLYIAICMEKLLFLIFRVSLVIRLSRGLKRIFSLRNWSWRASLISSKQVCEKVPKRRLLKMYGITIG